ncbi:MAG: FkbM family methyltransferase [Methylobacterium sp.]
MTPSGQSICLCMIVKNEAHVIRRCLDSVRPLIDRWLVVDTGSTDGTQALVRDHYPDIPGELVERPWQDFAHNRSEALALARSRADYTLIIDADDVFDVPTEFTLPDLEADSYVVGIRDANIEYQRTQLVRNTLPWRYAGVLHEYLVCEGSRTVGHLPVTMVRNHDGARRRDPETYRRDAALLERALATETDPFLVSRYTFYLAQSYRDCGAHEQAVRRYLERAELGYWDQEIFVSLYQAAKLMTVLSRPHEEILRTYARATEACPSRVEATHGAARLCRLADDFGRAAALAEPALGREAPAGGLFVETWIYAYGLEDEFAISAYWSGRYREAAEAAARVLASAALPETERARILRNRDFALDQIAKQAGDRSPPPSAGWVPSRPQGGTEQMVEGLRARLGTALDAIDLRINLYEATTRDDGRPLVVWVHHDIDQAAVQWCGDPALTDPVACFVFVSNWQRERFVSRFGLRPERCTVIRNAIAPSGTPRPWAPAPVYRCAYTSTPFRGLDVLLDVWARLPPGRAELHVWSSMKLYAGDDAPYRPLLERARSTPGVTYHGLAPNAELRAALRGMHFLTYPSTFAETACLSVMEAMEAGCRVVVPALGALPETTGGYARVYPWSPDPAHHATLFGAALAQEFADPWDGHPGDALAQQTHCAAVFAWDRRLGDWRRLIAALGTGPAVASSASVSHGSDLPSVPSETPMTRGLRRLRELGFRPAGILDIGAHDGAFAREARQVFPEAPILMLEALAEKEVVLEGVARALGNASYRIVLLGEEDAEGAAFFVVDTAQRPDLVRTGSSTFRENSDFPMIELTIPQRRLDGIVAELDAPVSLVKLDVQGGELAVLRGLGDRRATVEVILIEMSLVAYNAGAPLLADVVAQLAAWGFVLFDLVEEHRYRDGRLLQLDGIFVRTDSQLRPTPPFWC